jgi:hypothetical protein
MFEMFQTVRTTVPVPQLGLPAGALGVIVEEYSDPYPAYEIEFLDDDLEVIGFLSMRPDELTIEADADSRLDVPEYVPNNGDLIDEKGQSGKDQPL